MTTIDDLLSAGNWPAAVSAWGVGPERQTVIRESIKSWLADRGLTPRSISVLPYHYGPINRERRIILTPVDSTVDASVLLTFYVASGVTPSVLVDPLGYSALNCQPNESNCTCDELSEEDRDDGEECASCQFGTDWCLGHHSYH